MIHVLYFGGIFPSVVAPAFPVESQSLSRTPSRPLHMLTGGSECTHSAAVPRKGEKNKKNSKVKRHLVSKERRNKQHRPSTKERMLTSPSSSNSRLHWGSFERQKDNDDWSSKLLTIKQLKGHVQNYKRL